MTTTQPKRQPIPFGKYLLLDRINIGGMAEVWRGKAFGAGGFERILAIKRILPNIAEDDEFIDMFIDEAKISEKLQHANIARVEDLGKIANSYFIAMEYIPGKDLRAIFDRCRKKGEPAPIPLVAFVVSKMCEGLDFAHRKKDSMGRDLKIVHRDISPQNVLISFEGEVKVIDFGIAKAASKATKTQAGILKGKFGYMSPEQINGIELDGRSDIFAIGVCLYELLTGERLFVGDSDFSVLEMVRKAEVAPPSTYNRRIPETLERIVLKALARDVNERYQYANELGDDLQRFLLTQDTIFGRKDLMQYMKSTFAEDVEREKLRLQEYSEIKAPEGMLSAAEMGFSGAQSAPPPSVAPSAPPSSPGPVRRASTLTAMPKLTAAAAVPPPADDESGATIMMSSSELFDDPATQTGAKGLGQSMTPIEVPRAPVVDAQPAQRTPSLRMSPLAPPPAPRIPVPAPVSPESTTVARQGRTSTLEGMPRVSRPEPSESPPSVVPRPSLMAMPSVRPSPPPPQSPVLAPELFEAPPTVSGKPPRHAPVDPQAKSSRTPLLLALVALLVVMVGAGVFFALRPAPSGFLLVQLPPEVNGKAKVFINGEDQGSPESGLVLRPVPIGPAVVQVVAEGYAPFSLPVQIASGTTPTQVQVKLERTVRLTRLVVVTQPLDAELSVDGKLVREKGSTSTYMSEVQVGTEVVVAARAPGFKPLEKRVTPQDEKPLDLQLKLESDEFEVRVESEPSGATIFAGGRSWGTTPMQVRLPSGVEQVKLKLRCHEEASVDVAPAAGGSSAVVNKALKKKRDRVCR